MNKNSFLSVSPNRSMISESWLTLILAVVFGVFGALLGAAGALYAEGLAVVDIKIIPSEFSQSSVSGSAVVSSVRVSAESAGTVRVSWMTSVPSPTLLLYAAEGRAYDSRNSKYAYADVRVADGPATTTHSIGVSGLIPGVNYYFAPSSSAVTFLSARNASTTLRSSEVTFTTTPPQGACSPFTRAMGIGRDNNASDVQALQIFLRDRENMEVNVSGSFDDVTFEAVKSFQKRYERDIIAPWGPRVLTEPTGFVYITTLHKLNELYCNRTIPFTDAEFAILAAAATPLPVAAPPPAVIRPTPTPSGPRVSITPPTPDDIDSDLTGTTSTTTASNRPALITRAWKWFTRQVSRAWRFLLRKPDRPERVELELGIDNSTGFEDDSAPTSTPRVILFQ